MKYPEMARPITIVEVPPFERAAAATMTEAELDDFKEFIAWNPEAGVRIRGTGGVRKVRWATGDKGKSGGEGRAPLAGEGARRNLPGEEER